MMNKMKKEHINTLVGISILLVVGIIVIVLVISNDTEETFSDECNCACVFDIDMWSSQCKKINNAMQKNGMCYST